MEQVMLPLVKYLKILALERPIHRICTTDMTNGGPSRCITLSMEAKTSKTQESDMPSLTLAQVCFTWVPKITTISSTGF